MTSKTTTLNQTQKITTQVLNGNSVLVGVAAVTILTVAAGKIVQIDRVATRMISFGTNTLMDINIGGQRLDRRTVADLNLVDIPQGRNQVLVAGETIELSGDGAGNNGSINFMISYKETPA